MYLKVKLQFPYRFRKSTPKKVLFLYSLARFLWYIVLNIVPKKRIKIIIEIQHFGTIIDKDKE